MSSWNTQAAREAHCLPLAQLWSDCILIHTCGRTRACLEANPTARDSKCHAWNIPAQLCGPVQFSPLLLSRGRWLSRELEACCFQNFYFSWHVSNHLPIPSGDCCWDSPRKPISTDSLYRKVWHLHIRHTHPPWSLVTPNSMYKIYSYTVFKE